MALLKDAPRRWDHLPQTLVIFGLIKIVMVIGWWLTASSSQPDAVYLLGDIGWYTGIAENWYQIPPGMTVGVNETNLAFFPMQPMLMRPFMWVGLSAMQAGIVVSTIASLVAAAGIYKIALLRWDRRVAHYWCLVFAVWPLAVVTMSMPMSESVFCAFAAWSLYYLMRKQLIVAAVLSIGCGLTRTTSVAVILAVIWVAAYELVKRRQIRNAILAIVLAPAGFIGFVGYVGWLTDQTTGYLKVQEAWKSPFDFGAQSLRIMHGWLTGDLPPIPSHWLSMITIVTSIILAIAFFLIKPPTALTVFTVVILIMILGFAFEPSQLARLFTAAFTLLIPIALLLRRSRMTVAYTCIAVMGISAFITGTYYLNHLPAHTI